MVVPCTICLYYKPVYQNNQERLLCLQTIIPVYASGRLNNKNGRFAAAGESAASHCQRLAVNQVDIGAVSDIHIYGSTLSRKAENTDFLRMAVSAYQDSDIVFIVRCGCEVVSAGEAVFLDLRELYQEWTDIL